MLVSLEAVEYLAVVVEVAAVVVCYHRWDPWLLIVDRLDREI